MSRALRALEIKFAQQAHEGVSCTFCRQQFHMSYICARMRHQFGEYGHRGICQAQYLTRNHVTYYRQSGDIANLRLAVARARELWGHRPDTGWLDAAEEHAADPVDLFDLIDG
jgi:hypothetical protein